MAAVGAGYSAGLLLRHIPLSLHRMRGVVAEIRGARAGWGACLVLGFVGLAALCAETLARDVITMEPGFNEIRAEWGDPLFRTVAVGTLAAATIVVSLLAIVVFWAIARLFGAKFTLLESAIGVAAAALPQVVLSVAMVVIASVMAAFVAPETRLGWIAICDYVVIAAMLGYGVVAYSAATGLGLMATFALQVVGVCAVVILPVGGLALAWLGADYVMSWLVQLILGA